MPIKLPQSLKICLGTGLAALLLGLQNINEYTQQLESYDPELNEQAATLNRLAHSTGLPQFFAWQKELPNTLSTAFRNATTEPEYLTLTEPLPPFPPLPKAIPLIYPEPPPPPEPEPQPE
ncbi:MAG: hypothetical protein Q4F38_06185, partial [Akkermansia sp.]|nr:hypothetical protein [Akkermansia sp.]